MSTKQNTITTHKPSIGWSVSPVGKLVNVNGRVAKIANIGLSPYWPEMKDLVIRAYVVGLKGGWTDYLKMDELDFGVATCCDCGEEKSEMFICGECGRGLCCCDCQPFEPIESEEVLDAEYEQWLDEADRRFEEAQEYRAMRAIR